jgi:hypothetical protein
MPWKQCSAALAALLLGLLAAPPARAGDRATLRVTVRVVEACEIHVPDWVWEHVLKHKAKKAISHRCRGRGPGRIDFDPPGPPPWAHGRDDHRGRHHGRGDRHDRDDRHDRHDRDNRDDRHDRDDHRDRGHASNDRDHDRHHRDDRDRNDRDRDDRNDRDRGDDRDDHRDRGHASHDRDRDRDDDRGGRTVRVTITY